MNRVAQKFRNEGAEMERRAVRAFVRRQCSGEGEATETWIPAEKILAWLAGRTKRYRAAAGGLGNR